MTAASSHTWLLPSPDAPFHRLVPRIVLQAEAGQLLMHWDMDPQGRRKDLQGMALGRQNHFVLPLEPSKAHRGRLRVVMQARRLPQWVQTWLAERFDLHDDAWWADDLVLAASGLDRRGRLPAPRHLDGDPANCAIDNLAPVEGTRLPRIEGSLLATPEFGSFDEQATYLHQLLEALEGHGFRELRAKTEARVLLRQEEAAPPIFEARVTLRGRRASGARFVQESEAEASEPYHATLYALIRAARALLFGRNLPYCGPLLHGNLTTPTARLEPVNVEAGRYRLHVNLPGASGSPHVMSVHVEVPRPNARTQYLTVTDIPSAVKGYCDGRIDFKRTPIRLHRLIVALDGVSLLSPKEDAVFLRSLQAESEPVSAALRQAWASDRNHVHHVYGDGLDCRRGALLRRPEKQHRLHHRTWAASLEEGTSEVISVSQRMGRPQEFPLSSKTAPALLETLHTRLLQGHNLHRDTPSARREERRRVLKAYKEARNARSEVIKGDRLILAALDQHLGGCDATTLMRLTSLSKPSLHRRLRKLISAQFVTVHKSGRTPIYSLAPHAWPGLSGPRKTRGTRKRP